MTFLVHTIVSTQPWRTNVGTPTLPIKVAMASIQFSVYGVEHVLLGYAYANPTNCGDTVWRQARALGAKAYHVEEDAVDTVGVKLEDNILLGLKSSSKMPIPQVFNAWTSSRLISVCLVAHG